MISDGISVVSDINTLLYIVYFLWCEKLIFTSMNSVCSLSCVASIINVNRIIILGLF